MNNNKYPIRVLLVDDHELIRLGMRQVLRDIVDIKIVGEATSGEEALALINVLVPDVVLMDIKMRGIGGLETMKRIVSAYPEIRVLILTVYDEELYLPRALQYGAAGYVNKNANADEIVHAIRVVYHGKRYVSPEIAQSVVFSDSEEKKSPLLGLSDRELQIAIMIAKGHETSEISRDLNLSVKTINSYCYRIFKKLNIKGRVALVRLVLKHNLGS